MSKYKIADKIKDGSGTEWVVARVWEHPNHFDYELINTTTGEYGALREMKGR